MNTEFSIQNLTIGNSQKPIFVAEIGLNHNNDLAIAQKTIEAARQAGAHAVKFQSYITEKFIDFQNEQAKFLFDIFKKYQLSESMHRELKKIAEDNGLLFFSTPLCAGSLQFLVDDLQVAVLKIASGDLVNRPLLTQAAKSGLPLFLSTGAGTFSEVVRAVEYLQELKLENLCLFHCVSLYPTGADKVNLNTLSLYRDMYSFPLGFSDHSAGYLAAALSIAMGASVIEKHFTLDKNLEGPDHQISLNPQEFQAMVEHSEQAALMLGNKEKVLHKQEKDGWFFGRRSMYPSAEKSIPLRPALHLKDKDYLDSWQGAET